MMHARQQRAARTAIRDDSRFTAFAVWFVLFILMLLAGMLAACKTGGTFALGLETPFGRLGIDATAESHYTEQPAPDAAPAEPAR